jgi:amino acid adenylation domain-containing protein
MLSEVDYLFSIANGEILPDSLLKQPRRFAINYHNGPLPKYAGVHATSWAILNGERSHGVTWHRMEQLIDGGDILKQVTFNLDEDETTLSLNLKCYEHALEAFRELVDELANHTYQPRRQNLTDRSYFPLKKKPFGAGIICWANSAAEIDRLCRALNFGSYPNELGVAKFILGAEAFIPQDLRITSHRSGLPPGTIVGASETEISISTATDDVILSEVSALSGRRLKAGELMTRFVLSPGQTLFIPDQPWLRDFSDRVDACFADEEFWREQLKAARPATSPCFVSGGNDSDAPPLSGRQSFAAEIPLELREQISAGCGNDAHLRNTILAAVLIYLYRICREPYFTILYEDQTTSLSQAIAEPLFAGQVPFNITLRGEMTGAQAMSAVKQQAELVTQHRSYLKDIYNRDPYLRREPYTFPICIVIAERSAHVDYNQEFPLTICIRDDGSELLLFVNEASSDSTHLNNALEHIKNLLFALFENSKKSIAHLQLLSAGERTRVIETWGRTEAWYETPAAAHHLFERQAALTPDAPALLDPRCPLSYRQLDERAELLAAHLLALRLPDEPFVCLQLDRSPQLLIALLGVLKAGAVYVPLDPALPARRRAYILADTRAPVLIVERREEAEGLDFTGHLLALDESEDAPPSDVRERPRVSPQQLAYVMYTSGSTGRPKGVLSTHGGLANRLAWSLEVYRPTAGDVLLQNAAVGFDISIWEMLCPLSGGAGLAIVEAGRQKDVGHLVERVERDGVTLIHLVPSLLGLLLERGDAGRRCRGLRQVVCGGEVLPPGLVRRCEAELGARLHHAYGPTEASISVTHWESGEGGGVGRRVPLGRPIGGVRVYILDGEQEPVGAGVVGEIYIGGRAVGRGYLGRGGETAERFVPDCHVEGGEVMYRSGDLGRHLGDGRVEYIGRADRQVKVRGQRVELGEVEAALREACGVVGAAVVSRGEGEGLSLEGYVEVGGGGRAGAEEEERWTREGGALVPEYMVPARINVVREFPLTPNGKIDYVRLKALSDSLPSRLSESTVARNPIGFQLTEIWKRLLKVDDIGLSDDFFNLGGHSLLAIRLVSEIEKAFPMHDINITHVFKQPTIAALTNVIADKVSSEEPNPLMQISDQGKSCIFLVHPGEGLAYCYTTLSKHLSGVKLYGISNPRFGDTANAFGSLQEMAACYIEYIQRVQPVGPYLVGGWSFGGVVAFEMAQQLKQKAQDVAPVLMIDSYNLSAFPQVELDLNAVEEFLVGQGINPHTREGAKLRWELTHNGKLSREYCPPKYDGEVVLLKATQPEEAFAIYPAASENGWRACTGANLKVYSVPGGHEELFHVRNVVDVARRIQSVLNHL